MDREGGLGKVVVVVLALAVLATLVDAAIARRQEKPQKQDRVLSVRAEGYVEAEPDVARISLGIKATRPTPREAAGEVAGKVDAIKAKLAQLGVGKESVETSELYLGEATERPYGRPAVHLGYKAYHWLRVTLKREDFGKLASVVDGAVASGATSLSDLTFDVESDNALRAQALAKATANAREKAEAMASAAKARIVGVQSISDNVGYEWDYEESAKVGAAAAPAAAAAAPAEAPPGEPVPGKLRITCKVRVAFLLS